MVKVISEALIDYPEFYHTSPSHYTEANVIQKSIEGLTSIKIDCESFEPLKKMSKVFLRTLFRWMFNQEFKGIFESNFKLVDIKTISSYQNQSISSLRAYVKEYSDYLQTDLFSTLVVYPVS